VNEAIHLLKGVGTGSKDETERTLEERGAYGIYGTKSVRGNDDYAGVTHGVGSLADEISPRPKCV
jgi:hypothetical protein